jgi:hypothetical protein
MTQRIRIYARLIHGDPLPENAKLVSKFEGQPHGKYGTLIEIPSEPKNARGKK